MIEAATLGVNVKSDIDNLLTDMKSLKSTLDTTQTGFDNANKKTKNFTGSLIKSELAVEALKKAFDFLKKSIQQGIKSASDYAETSGKYGTVFKGVRKEADGLKKELQNIYDLSKQQSKEFLSSMQDTLVPLGFARKDAALLSGEITKLSIDLGSFNNIATNDVMKDFQSALVGNTEVLRKYGIVITAASIEQEALNRGIVENAKDLTAAQKAQIIYDLAVQSSGDALGDYLRTQDQLANTQRALDNQLADLSNNIGSFFLPIVKEMTAEAKKTVEAFNSFIESSKGFEILSNVVASSAGTLAITKEIVGELYETIKPLSKEIGETLINGFYQLTGESKNSGFAFKILAGLTQSLIVGFRITSAMIKAVISHIVNLVDSIKQSAGVIGKFYDLLTGKAKWKDVKDQIEKTKDAFTNIVIDYASGVSDIIQTTKDELTGFSDNTKELSNKLEETYKSAFNRTKKILKENREEEIKVFQEGEQQKIEAVEKTNDEIKKKNDKLTNEINYQISGSISAYSGTIESLSSSIINMMTNTTNQAIEGFDKFKEAGRNTADKISFGFQVAQEAIVSTITAVQEIVNEFQTNELDSMTAHHEAQLEQIDYYHQLELESLGLAEETKTQTLEKELEELKNKLANEKDQKKAADLQEKIEAKKQALEKAKIDEKYEKQKTELEKQQAKERYDKEVKIFNTKKIIQATTVIISGLLGSVVALVNAIRDLGFPAGPIVGGIQAGVIATATGISAGMILAQAPPPPPAFTLGGVVPGNQKTGDQINIKANSAERILTAEQNQLFEKLVYDIATKNYQSGDLIIQLLLDSQLITEKVIENINYRRRLAEDSQ